MCTKHLRNGNYTTIVVRKNCDSFYGLKKPSSSEHNHGSDSVILNNSKTSSSVLYQGGCSVGGEIFQIYSRLTTLGKMGLGLVYPPMATLEHPAPASRSGLDSYVSKGGPLAACGLPQPLHMEQRLLDPISSIKVRYTF